MPRGAPSPYDLDWTSSIDPGLAFLALRSRSSFTQFITYIRPRVAEIYAALRPSGMHQLFASDVLIRSGDFKAIHRIIELDAETRSLLRPSALVAMYEHIRPHLMNGRLPPLSIQAIRLISNALMTEGNTELVPEIYTALINATDIWEPKESWPFFALILHMLNLDKVDQSLAMLQRLIVADCLPQAASGRTDPNHPEAKRILILSMVLRSCLTYGMYNRINGMAEELLSIMERTRVTRYVPETLFQLCRVDIAGKNPAHMEWAGKLLLRFARLPNSPRLPSTIINMFLENNEVARGSEWYLQLPDSHEPPSAIQIMRMARLRPNKRVLTELLNDVLKLPPDEFRPHHGEFLGCMVAAEQVEAVMGLYETWKTTLRLTPSLAAGMIKLLKRKRPDDTEAIAMIDSIVTYYARTAEHTVARQLTLARIYLVRLGEGATTMAKTDGSRLKGIQGHILDVKHYVKDVMKEDPAEGELFTKYLADHGIVIEVSTDHLWEICFAGNWKVLDQLKDLVLVKSRPDTSTTDAGAGPVEHSALAETTREGGQAELSASTRRLIDLLSAVRAHDFASAEITLNDMDNAGDAVPLGLRIGVVRRSALSGSWSTAMRIYTGIDVTLPARDLDLPAQAKWRSTGIWLVKKIRSTIGTAENSAGEAGGAPGRDELVDAVLGDLGTKLEERMRAIRLFSAEWDERKEKQEDDTVTFVRRSWEELRAIAERATGQRAERAIEHAG